MELMPKDITTGAKYDTAMQITGQAEADAYFERCVQHTMTWWGRSREDAEKIERANIGYYAGYGSQETRHRVERLFCCSHPVFGTIAKVGAPTPEEAFQAGLDSARRS